ncbi:hypothetical protein AC1031_008150 [Aphanomyces cochlioides]|nr:hypothetical protein AC1031_008150 [Aphanomyces cochlioides]
MVGVVVVMFSMAMSIVYLSILESYVENDYFWTHFNTSGAQTFLSDVFNAQLWNTSKDLLLFTIDVAIEKDYSTPGTAIAIQATDTRRTIMEQLNNLPRAIVGLRSQTGDQAMRSLMCYCWIDFNQQWEVAHTAGRQARCRDRYFDNGAVYMEAMLRNTDWAAFSQRWGPVFDLAYGSAIYETAGGIAWLNQTTSALATTSPEAELRYWVDRYNIQRYVLPWHNRHISGFTNSVLLRTALQTFSLTLNQVQYERRVGLWTSVLASYGAYNEFNYAEDTQVSLVRNASNSFTRANNTLSQEMWTGGYPDTPWSRLLHDNIGPLASIDLIYVLPPSSLTTTLTTAYTTLVRDIQMDQQLNALYQAVSAVEFDMVPLSWTIPGVQYAGGTPLCYVGSPTLTVEQSFGFDDACSEFHPPMSLHGDAKNIMLALMFLQADSSFGKRIPDICSLNQNAIGSCQNSLNSIPPLFALWESKKTLALPNSTEIMELGIGLMQYAMVNDIPTTLHQPLLDPDDFIWNFYGWLHLVDWIQGRREVVAFECDVSTVTLISKAYMPLSFTVDPLQTPTRFSYAVWMLILYTCILETAVIVAALAFGIVEKGIFHGSNLWFASSVVGVVWIGRPPLIVRGLTAITALSTAKIQLEAVGGFTRFVVPSRSFLESILLSGETLWLTYSLNDILSVLARDHSYKCAVGSIILVWALSLALDVASPFVPWASLSRRCESPNMDAQMNCITGCVEIGSFMRFSVLCILQAASVVISYAVARFLRSTNRVQAPVTIPAVSVHLLRPLECKTQRFYFDNVSSVISGLIPCSKSGHDTTFSVLLWMFIPTSKAQEITKLRNGRTEPLLHIQHVWSSQPGQHFRALFGVLFLLASAVSSALFFYVTEAKLSNDFLWDGFNSTGMQAFLMSMYNEKLLISPGPLEIDLDSTILAQFFNLSSTTVVSSALYMSTMQFEELSLRSTISGLRSIDGCQAPWIATQYCWLDFDREWEMANSLKRQQRCRNMTSNGAVFLETVFRNIPWQIFYSCWGQAVEIAIFRDLRQSIRGKQWIDSVQSIRGPIDAEENYWLSKNISTFTVQWQNYKSYGILETISVQSALGFHANFAFLNYSMEDVLVQNKSTISSLNSGLAIVRDLIGPFGSIDLVHIPFPPELTQLVVDIRDNMKLIMSTNLESQASVVMSTVNLVPTPFLWSSVYTISRGGNILCPITSAKSVLSTGLLTFFNCIAACNALFGEYLFVTQQAASIALIAWGGLDADIENACLNSTGADLQCRQTLLSCHGWIESYVPQLIWEKFHQKAQMVQKELADLNIEIVQYAQMNDSSPVELLRMNIFDTIEPTLWPFSWLFMIDWVDGLREVVSLQGDAGTLTAVSSLVQVVSSTPNSLEIPINLAYYCQQCIQYTTLVIFLVTFIALLYAGFVHGQIEGFNMFGINRVAGIVWLGRPMLFLRCLVAILLLSTSIVTLETCGKFTRLSTPKSSTMQNFSTVLAGSESCWLVIVVTDLGIVITKDCTRRYALYCIIVTTIGTVILSFVSPILPKLVLSRTCQSAKFDFEMKCQSGIVQIGNSHRVIELVIMTMVVVVVCFAFEMWRCPNYALSAHKMSRLVPAGAHYLYSKGSWVFHNIFYLDKASAFMCGLITITYDGSIYVLDVKTWRTRMIQVETDFSRHLISDFDQERISNAVPMVE